MLFRCAIRREREPVLGIQERTSGAQPEKAVIDFRIVTVMPGGQVESREQNPQQINYINNLLRFCRDHVRAKGYNTARMPL
jgi:hypothetical protein